MKIELPYGETTVTAELPGGTRLLGTVERATLPPVDDLDGAVRAALAAPRGLSRIRRARASSWTVACGSRGSTASASTRISRNPRSR